MSRQVGVLLTACVAASTLLVGGPAAAASPDAPAPSAVPAPALAPPAQPDRLGVGDELTVGEQIASPNGQYLLTLQADGNAVLYVRSSGRARWATGTTGRPAGRLAVQADGNLVLYGSGSSGGVLWASNTAGHTDARLALLDDGSLVLAWTGGRRELKGPDSQLAAGEHLVAGQRLTSPQGRFSLVMQADGNLVEIATGTGPVWASGTTGRNVTALDRTGDLVVRGRGLGAVKWTTGTTDPRARLVVQDDGNLVLYAGDTAVWSRGEDEKRRAAAAVVPPTTATLSPGDDYPDKAAVPCGSGVYCQFGSKYSARGFAYRNCTDFVAWKLGLTWSQIADGRNGHAVGWRQGWIERGRAVGTTPRVGAVAWWSRGSYGHVAYVVAVNPDGSAVVEQYNAGGTGTFSTETVRAEAYLY